MINKWSHSYEVIRLYGNLVHRAFYKKIRVRGTENIPKGKPIIFAPNHQNALMDPLAILYTQRKQTIFLTRADIFNNPILLKIFTYLKMLPVYRIRDGAESLQNNERIFNESVKVLESKDSMALALFPEGRHTDLRFLWPLKKAVQRIAFRAMEKHDFDLDIHIIPVGIYYSEYPHSQSTVQVNYGEPIHVKDFEKIYKVNAQKGMTALREAMTDGIHKEMIHIQNQDKYELFEFVRVFYRHRMLEREKLPRKEAFRADQKSIALLNRIESEQNERFNEIDQAYQVIKDLEKTNKVKSTTFQEYSFGKWLGTGLLSLFSLPIFIFAFINLYWLHYILLNFLNKKVKDKQFHSSIKYGVSLFLPLILFPIMAGIVAIFAPCLFWYYWLALVLAAWLGIKAKYLYLKWFAHSKVLGLRMRRKAQYNKMLEAHTKLQELIDKAFV